MIVGVYGGLAGLAVALGPIVGGVITEAIDWHWIFWINVPIGVLCRGAPRPAPAAGELSAPTNASTSRRRAGHRGRRRDRVGAHARQRDRLVRAQRPSCTLAAGSVLLAAFVGWEQRATEPMVPLRLFAAASSRSGTSRASSCRAPPSPPRSSSHRSSSSRAATRRWRPVCACCRSSPPRCSSHRSRARSPTASAVGRSWSPGSPCRRSASSGLPLAAR